MASAHRTIVFGLLAAATACSVGCSSSTPTAPRPGQILANIGPDVNLMTTCAGSAAAAVASVNNLGGPAARWTVSLAGSPAFQPGTMQLETDDNAGPTVAMVTFTAPTTARAGDTFDAVATVSALDGSFATGTVKLHAQIGATTVTAEPSSLDFGEVPFGPTPLLKIVFRNASPGDVYVTPPATAVPFMVELPQRVLTAEASASALVQFLAADEADHAQDLVWTFSPVPDAGLPAACTTEVTTHLHGRGVRDAGVADAGVDAF